jgi:WD40 repeat protein
MYNLFMKNIRHLTVKMIHGLMLVILLAACSPAAMPTPASEPVPTETETSLPAAPTDPTVEATPTSAPTATVVADSSSDGGPWLVAMTQGDAQLVAVKPDGSTINIQLPDGLPIWSARDLTLGASPHGGWLAVRTGNRDYTGLKLHLIHLPDGEVKTLTPLLSEENEARVQAADLSSLPAAALAVTQPDTLSWSPDGRYLAYIAAVDGRSSDLYVYDTRKDQTRRITHGSYECAMPFWSPDGQFILIEQVLRFTTNSQWVTHSVWAISIDRTNDLRKLYVPPADSIGEIVLGWKSPDVMLVSTKTLLAQRRAREVNLERRRESVMVASEFDEIAYDPKSQSFAFTISAQTAASTELVPGLYLVKPYKAARLAQMGNWSHLEWSAGMGRFIASGMQGVISVSPVGDLTLIKNEIQAEASPDGQWIAAWGDGLRLYGANGKLLQTVSNQTVDEIVWKSDSNAVYYRVGDNLYSAAFPLAAEEKVASGLMQGSEGGMGWLP